MTEQEFDFRMREKVLGALGHAALHASSGLSEAMRHMHQTGVPRDPQDLELELQYYFRPPGVGFFFWDHLFGDAPPKAREWLRAHPERVANVWTVGQVIELVKEVYR